MNTFGRVSKLIFNTACIALFVFAAFLAGSRDKVSARVDAVHIPANAGWVNTGFFLEQHHTAYLTTHGMAHTGKINLYPGAQSGPGGQDWNLGCGQYDGAPPPCALNDAPYGALVGKVGVDGEPFYIGEAQDFWIPATGYLYLAVNDNLDYYADNAGGFTVILRGGNFAGGYIAARPDLDYIEGRYWTPGEPVRLRIFDVTGGIVYKELEAVAGEPWDEAGTNIFFDLAAQGFDLQAGQRVLVSSGGYTRELWVAPVAVTGYSIQDATTFGVCDPTIFCWTHFDDRDFSGFVMDGENWTAYYEYIIPGEGGWAFQWDADGDETRIRFEIPAE